MASNASGYVCLPLGHDSVNLLEIAVQLDHENRAKLLLPGSYLLPEVGGAGGRRAGRLRGIVRCSVQADVTVTRAGLLGMAAGKDTAGLCLIAIKLDHKNLVELLLGAELGRRCSGVGLLCCAGIHVCRVHD